MAASADHRLDLPLDRGPLNVPALLRQHGLRPDKSLGQNFLTDPAALARLIATAEVEPADTVLEIGAGLGSLTVLLAERARQVIAVELDPQLIPPLHSVLAGRENVRIVQGDILELDIAALLAGHPPGGWGGPFEGAVECDEEGGLRHAAGASLTNSQATISSPAKAGDYLIVANIPYYITSALIRHLLAAQIRPRRMVLTVQREVADRICAQPGKPRLRGVRGEMSLLALSVQVYGQPEIAFTIPAGAFYPRPRVDSAAVSIDIFDQPLIPTDWLDTFFRLAKAGFGQKRKMLRNALAHGLGLQSEKALALLNQAGIDPKRRAETLTLEEWKTLTGFFIKQ